MQSAVQRLRTFVQAWNGAEVLENQVRIARIVSKKKEHVYDSPEEMMSHNRTFQTCDLVSYLVTNAVSLLIIYHKLKSLESKWYDTICITMPLHTNKQ